MPSLADSSNINSTTVLPVPDLVTASFTPSVGDVIVVKGIAEDSADPFSTPTDTQGNTYTLRTSDASSSHVWAGIWTAVAGSATSMTVSVATIFTGWRSITVEIWTSASLDTTPATNGTKIGSGTPSTTVVTTGTGSVVSWCCGDWNAISPAGRIYDTTSATPTEDGLHDKSTGNYVAYYAYQYAGSPTSQTFGLTSPGGQAWTLLGIEVLNVAAPGDPAGADQYGRHPWQ